MTIPDTCPHCGAAYHKDGRFACGSEWISGRAFQSPLCKLNAAAKELLIELGEMKKTKAVNAAFENLGRAVL